MVLFKYHEVSPPLVAMDGAAVHGKKLEKKSIALIGPAHIIGVDDAWHILECKQIEIKQIEIKQIDRRIMMDDDIRALTGSGEDLTEQFDELSDKAIEKENEEGYEALSERERPLFLAGKLLMEVNNGGFDQYFLNTEEEVVEDTLEFLEEEEEAHFLPLLKEAWAIYGSDQSDDDKFDALTEVDDAFYSMDLAEFEALYRLCLKR